MKVIANKIQITRRFHHASRIKKARRMLAVSPLGESATIAAQRSRIEARFGAQSAVKRPR